MHASRPGNASSECKVQVGAMATGGIFPLNDAIIHNLRNSSDFRDIIGGEMDAWGLYQAISTASTKFGPSFEWIVVKGISSWGYGESMSWRTFAAASALDLIFMVTSARDFLPGLKVRAIPKHLYETL